MLLAPLAMQSGAAMAMAPSDHHGQMMESGHCGGKSAGDTQDKKMAGKNCCAAMCAAAAVSDAATVEPHLYVKAAPAASAQDFQFGFFGELPTPPPRAA